MEYKFCVDCGCKNIGTAKFCLSCGYNLGGIHAQPQSQTQKASTPKPTPKPSPQVFIVDSNEPSDDGMEPDVEVDDVIHAADNTLANEIFKHVQKMGLNKTQPIALENAVGTQPPRQGKRKPKEKISAKDILKSTENRRNT